MTFDDENGLPPGLLGEMMGDVVRNNKEKGWYDADRTFGDEIALLHSELSEALEAFRDNGVRSFKVHEDGLVCYREGEGKECNAPGKPEGVGSEFADVLIRLLDASARYGIDLEAEYRRKMAYNLTRPYRHGGRAL